MRTGLLLAWLAAATVLAVVGLGVHSLLALAERRRQFAYAVSHELRTPLTTFRLYTDMLAGGLVPDQDRDEYLATLNRESERLSDLVAGVLEYSRIEHQSPTLAPVETTIGQILDLARQRFDPQCAVAERKLIIDTNGLADHPVNTDPDLVLQIIGTLIDNACKYARNADDARIILSASRGPLRIEVRDFGPGVPRGQRRRIFKPFRRGETGATDQAGIGLGLALASRWARLLGGKLDLVRDGQHSHGACFRLSL
jgi:signal transduction histidine kinase